MNKRRGLIVLTLMTVIFIIYAASFVAGDVFLSKQPENVYSIGDTFNVALSSDGTEGWVGVDLNCNNQTKMLYFHYLTADEDGVDITVPLTKNYLRGMIGSCFLSIDFNGAKKTSFPFSISNEIEVTESFSGESFRPDESVTFTGTGKKANRKSLNGYVELKFSGISLELIVSVINDQFYGNLTIPSNVAAGDYPVIIKVYDKDNNNEIINFGSVSDSIIILQKPTKLILKVSDSFYPGNESSFNSLLYDQTGQIIKNAPVSYQLLDIEGNEILSKLSTTDEDNYFIPEKNAPFGYWNLTAVSEEIISEKQIYIEKNIEAVFELVNGTLIIRNIGNVQYNKSIEIMIGNETKVKHLNLQIGDTVQFELTAPDGKYKIRINDGEKSEEWEGISLTGAAISLDGSGRKVSLGFFNRNWLAWIFIIGVLGLFILIASKKFVNKNVIVSSKDYQKSFTKEFDKGGVVKITPGENNKPILESDTGLAQHSMVIDGTKQTATLIAIKLKNYQELKTDKSSANDTLKEVIREITEASGKVYRNEDFIIGIFAPLATRTYENDIAGVKCGKKILAKLKEHNRRFSQKIEFGIAINTGDIIAKKDAGKLLFNPLGTTLLNAKKIAEIAKNDILLSEETHKKVMGQVKATLNVGGALKTYTINEVVDRESNSKFIESFLQRNQEHKTLRDMKLGRLDKDNSKNSLNQQEEKTNGFDINEWKK